MASLHPTLVARAQAVKAAHAHLAKTHPGWSTLTPQERFKAVHAHVDRGKLSDQVTTLRAGGAFRSRTGT